MWEALRSTFDQLSTDDTVRCVVVRGAGGHFAAGADISEFAQVRHDRASGTHYHMNVIAPALTAVATCPHPTVAAIEGNCVGGGLEIAASCDLRIAQRQARFGIPIHRLGFPLAPLEMQAVLALVGKAVTLELLLEGQLLNADTACVKGLVQHVTDTLDKSLQTTIENILRGSPEAARISKRLARHYAESSQPLTADQLDAAFAYLDSENYRAGIAAFLGKRPPPFQQ